MRKRGGELYGRVERAAEGWVRTCGRRRVRGAYIEVEYEGEEGWVRGWYGEGESVAGG